jgi:hypothetical protein
MARRCTHRLATALLVVLSLLFSQLALAHYVCPGQGTMKSMAAMAASGHSCDGMDRQQPTLCHQHAADPGKTFEVVKLPAVSLPAVVQVLELPLVLEATIAASRPGVAASQAQAPPGPLYLSTLRLRV